MEMIQRRATANTEQQNLLIIYLRNGNICSDLQWPGSYISWPLH